LTNANFEQLDVPKAEKLPATSLQMANQQYKVFGSQLCFNKMMNDFIHIIKFSLPLKQIKYYEGSLALNEMMIKYNQSLKQEVLECGAYKREKVKNITGRHLALSSNCIMLVLNEVFPNIKNNFVLSDQTNYGFNIKKKIEDDLEEVETSLRSHLDKVFKKLTSIMYDACKDAIANGAAEAINWDNVIEKQTIIEP
jgi:hypothetical protein